MGTITSHEERIMIPMFSTWERENLEKIATDLYLRNKQLIDQNEQLRLDNKDLSNQLRNYVDDWK
jgi:hypothetical protein